MVNYKGKPETEEGRVDNLIPILEKGMSRFMGERLDYVGLWTEEELVKEVYDFFLYCNEHGIKTCKAALRLWLGMSRDQYHNWEKQPEKFGYKSRIIQQANDVMETQMIGRAEKYPTANVFLLKSSHGHVESSRLDVTTNGQSMGSADEIRDLVSKLGLDQKK